MIVEDMIKFLQKLPPKMEVFIENTEASFQYTPIETVEVRKIPFKETPGGETLATDEVVVVSTDF